MNTSAREIAPRTSIATGLLLGAAVVAVGAVLSAIAALRTGSGGSAAAYAGVAVVLLVVGVLLPALLARKILRTRVVVDDAAGTVSRLESGRVVARMSMSEVEQVKVAWQTAPGVMRRQPAITLLGPTGSRARGIAANGIVLDDVTPLLELVSAEVARRPGVLTSDPAVLAEALAAR